jgi:transposase
LKDVFPRLFGKEIVDANAHCSPHHSTTKRTRRPASFNPGSFHAAISGFARPDCVKSCWLRPPDEPAHRPDLGCSNRTVGKWRQRYLELGLSGLQDAVRSGRPRAFGSNTRFTIISVASQLPQAQTRRVTRWTLDEIVAPLLDNLHTDAISRSTSWRILHEVDLKPHKSEYWRNRHDETFESKAQAICRKRSQGKLTKNRQVNFLNPRLIFCNALIFRHIWFSA